MDDLISRKALLVDLCEDREEGTFEFTDAQAEAADRIIRYVVSRIEKLPSVPAVPLDIVSKKLASTCKPCTLPFIRCPDENHDCKICNGRKAWEEVIKKWMEEQNA